MARAKKSDQQKTTNNGANVGYEAELWQMADALRGSMDAAEYKHVVLGLIFLKYISDAFEEQHAKLEAEKVAGRRPGRPGRVSCAQYLLGPSRSALVTSESPGEAADYRSTRRRRDVGDRA